MLCKICTHVVSELLSMQQQQLFVENMTPVHRLIQIPENQESTKERIQNCYMCKQSKIVIEDLAVRSQSFGEDSERQLKIFVGTESDRLTENDNHFIVQALSRDIHHLGRNSLLSGSSGSHKATALAMYWLKDCLLNHPECNIESKAQWYPTRLLDVSTSTVRLVNTALERPNGPYVTMSHCWGSEKFTVLTAENLKIFESGLALSEFATNFEDAIAMTQRLGFRYIWIDCFCIVQYSTSKDHMDDKLLEISTMKDVYANGILNIGASDSSGPYFGLFSDRNIYPGSYTVDNPFVDFFHPSLPLLDGSTAPFRIYSTERARVDAELLLNTRIFGRGWILQERLLCRRMLHFGISQLHWECGMLGPASESFPCAEGHSIEYDAAFNCNNSDLVLSPLRFWLLTVKEYMAMDLSYPAKDKLLAIGAIAQRVAEATNDQYIAGFLAKDLIVQLGWESSSGGRRATSWRAPSWSWASMDDSRLRFGYITTKIVNDPRLPLYVNMAWIQDIRLEFMDPNNKYGALKSASLAMECRCIAAHPPEQQIDPDGTSNEIWKCALVDIDCCPLSVCVDDWHHWPTWGAASIPSLPLEATERLTDVTPELYILPLYMWFVTAEDIMAPVEALADIRLLQSCASIHGLLVQKLSANIYVRRGCLEYSESDPEARDYEGLLKLWAAKENEMVSLF